MTFINKLGDGKVSKATLDITEVVHFTILTNFTNFINFTNFTNYKGEAW